VFFRYQCKGLRVCFKFCAVGEEGSHVRFSQNDLGFLIFKHLPRHVLEDPFFKIKLAYTVIMTEPKNRGRMDSLNNIGNMNSTFAVTQK